MDKLRKLVDKARWLNEQGYKIDNKGRLLHRIVCRTANGWFPKRWVVHHIDENKLNNSPENLIAMPSKLHNTIHSFMKSGYAQFTRSDIELLIKNKPISELLKVCTICKKRRQHCEHTTKDVHIYETSDSLAHVKVYPDGKDAKTWVLFPRFFATRLFNQMLKGRRFTFEELLDLREKWYISNVSATNDLFGHKVDFT